MRDRLHFQGTYIANPENRLLASVTHRVLGVAFRLPIKPSAMKMGAELSLFVYFIIHPESEKSSRRTVQPLVQECQLTIVMKFPTF